MPYRQTPTTYYRYLFTRFKIDIPGEEEPIELLNSNINMFSIEKDFDNDLFPILHVNLTLSPKVYYQIMSNKTKVKFIIRIDKYLVDKDKPEKVKEQVISDKFSIFTDENSPFLDEELYETTRKMNGDKTQMGDFRKTYDFYFFKENKLLHSKKIINLVVSNGKMQDVAAYLLSSSKFTNVLMSPFDNNRTYHEIIIPPFSLVDSLNYLDERYGFYSYGKTLFFDFTTDYLLSSRAGCTAWKKNEPKDINVFCNKSINPNSYTPGVYKDPKKKTHTLYITKDNITLLTASIIDDQLIGTELITVSPALGSLRNIKPEVQHLGSGVQHVMVNRYHNEFTLNALEWRRKENDNVIGVNLIDIDIDYLTPNKRFIFSFEDTAVQKSNGGDYRLCDVRYVFEKQGTEFSVIGNATFKKSK